MKIQTLAGRLVSRSEIARLLGITEGAACYRIKRMETGAVYGRARQQPLASTVAEAIEHWREPPRTPPAPWWRLIATCPILQGIRRARGTTRSCQLRPSPPR